MLDHGAGRREPVQVPGFGEDRRRTDPRQARDRAHHVGQIELVRHADHALLDDGPAGSSGVPVGEDPTDALQGAEPMGLHPERAGLHDLVDDHVTVPGPAGANASVKVSAIIAGMRRCSTSDPNGVSDALADCARTTAPPNSVAREPPPYLPADPNGQQEHPQLPRVARA